MLKLTCSYSRKGPADEEYSSRSYHAGLELELPAGLTADQINDQVHGTFAQLKASVEAELNGQASTPQPQLRVVSDGTGGARAESKDSSKRISNAQAKFALDLARKHGIGLNELDQMIHDEYGVPGLYDLTGGKGGQASDLIDRLKVKKAA